MNVEQFTSRRQDDWTRLGNLIRAAGSKPERLPSAEVLELGSLYRAAVGDLSQLRSHYPDDAVTQRLNLLVINARQLVYGTQRKRTRMLDVLFHEYWQRIAEGPVQLAIATAALLIPALLGSIWVAAAPDAAIGVVPGVFQAALEPGPDGTDQGMTGSEQLAFSASLFTNNTQVAIFGFALGVLLCAGSVMILAINGLILGVIAAFLISRGNGGFFVELAAAHGILEISCIVVAAAAGIRVGWAIVDPGRLARAKALRNEARAAVVVVAGTAVWLAVAAFIEGFVSRRGLSALPITIIGLLVGGTYWYLVWRARGSQSSERLGLEVGRDTRMGQPVG